MKFRTLLVLACTGLTTFAFAAADAPANTDALVKKVDAAKEQVTLQHGPIDTIKMPAMTMSFGLKDEALLKTLKPGDKLKVRIEEIDGRYVVVRAVPAP